MKKSKQGKAPMKPRTMLQIRVVHQDHTGSIQDVTQADRRLGHGLKDLQWRADNAAADLIDVTNLIKLLALASENRSTVDADVVRHVVAELGRMFESGSDIENYVSYTQSLFEEAMALPFISGIRPEVFDVWSKKEDRSLALAS